MVSFLGNTFSENFITSSDILITFCDVKKLYWSFGFIFILEFIIEILNYKCYIVLYNDI